MYSGNAQQKNPSCVQHPVSLRTSLPDANSVIFGSHRLQNREKPLIPYLRIDSLSKNRFLISRTYCSMYSSRLYAKNPVFKIVHEESVKVYHLHNIHILLFKEKKVVVVVVCCFSHID